VNQPPLPLRRASAGIFLIGFVAAAVGQLAGIGHSNAEILLALRGITAVAGIVLAISILAERAHGADAGTNAPPASTKVRTPAPPSIARPRTPAAVTVEDAERQEAGFLGLVSHELRTPLTAMQLLLDRLNDPQADLPPRQRKLVERLNGSAARLTDLVDSILYYARIQNGRVVTSVEPFDLASLAKEAAEELRPQAERKSIALESETAADRVGIESDPKLVRLVIVNLLSNAVKFTERGSIAVSTRSEGERRVVRVEDTGRGIAPEEQARIFEPFQSLEPSMKKHQPGLGLGLSLAKRIVETLGGRITVSSELGRGSAFELSLPKTLA
jgi:signal transduction histidine kinase